MNKTYKNFIFLFVVVISTLLYFLNKYNNIIEQNEIDIFVSNQVELVQQELTNQKNQALSLAILFSKNQNIIDNLEQDKPKELKKEILKLLEIIKTYSNQNNLQVQIHTKDLKVFVRSWEDKDSGLSLESFRKGLVKVKETKEPYVSNELGKRFNIKAIAPIFNKSGEYIGTIEVIMDYSDLKNRLKYMGIDIIALLEKEYLQIAKSHQNSEFLYDYVVIEDEYDKSFFDFLLSNKEYLSNKKFYYENKNKIITQIPLGDVDKQSIGLLMIRFDKDKQKFSYLPRYEYKGDINIKSDIKNKEEIEKKEIIIR
ncbi:putative MCP-domain signal transduction protein [Aliarcobacter butzleri 7h1h]|uniref:Chemotaxis protein n=1 Tax=Aliarcobacter butzleri L351 TaxID=1447259 RepID=A0A837J4W3_9BACT|nr:cache domain-containing protein [Aliarcobacter butzleri]AGR77214.1 putative MCP-domain signal transduction protein [Aliarcobacter butzleri 7h1h]KLE00513.1 chemotaxis protein [Aliarcobacter butzleri L351]KLE12713.1 chemotaxis protein [Aliarcobacter butzleri L350]MCG3696391.1 chemotaxis protein [Aliarcobacter butzleri]MCG3698658.1 chemotaxis protein [Aliarcobacter butzleri]